MASLQIRDLPVDIEQKLKEQAKKNHRSLAQEAIVSLKKGLGIALDSKEKRLTALDELLDSPILNQGDHLKSPEELIREDRDR